MLYAFGIAVQVRVNHLRQIILEFIAGYHSSICSSSWWQTNLITLVSNTIDEFMSWWERERDLVCIAFSCVVCIKKAQLQNNSGRKYKRMIVRRTSIHQEFKGEKAR